MEGNCEVSLIARNCAWLSAIDGLQKMVTEVVSRTVTASDRVGSDSEVSVVLTGDSESRKLNGEHRGIHEATNVLSFPIGDLEVNGSVAVLEGRPLILGDVVVAYETSVLEAEKKGKPLADHLAHLLVHGVLHLCGYDHTENGEAGTMEDLEICILRKLGIPDPYLPEDGV